MKTEKAIGNKIETKETQQTNNKRHLRRRRRIT